MNKIYILITFLFAGIFFFCENSATVTENTLDSAVAPATDTTKLPEEYAYEQADTPDHSEEKEPQQTRLRFPHFSVVIHDFSGYEIVTDDEGNKMHSGQFGDYYREHEAHLNTDEKDQEGYLETLVVTGDSVHLSESLFDNDIENNLLQIIPENTQDRFKLAYCYMGNVYELFEHLKLSRYEKEKLYDNRFYRPDYTSYIPVPDSARVFFRLALLKDGEEQAGYVNGRMSKQYHRQQQKRIKDLYGLRDTLIQYAGEGGAYYATFTKNGRLFGYDTDAYLIRIERYTGIALADTRYIVVFIAYGC